MNILHIVNGWPPGGCIEQTYLACKYLPEKYKHFSIGFTHFDGSFVKKFEDIGVPCIHSDTGYSKLKEVIDEYKIDIVHTQTGGGDYEAFVPMLKEWGIPLIHWLHCPRKCAIPLDEVSKILYTTQYTLEKNPTHYHSKMKSIQYSLDLNAPIVEKREHENTTPLKVGRLGKIIPDKRPDVLLALAKMSYIGFGKDVEFHIAGMIPQDMSLHVDYGKKWLEEAKKIPNITYHGFVEDKYEFWKTLDICINPVWETSFDIVFLEAMACGIPSLTWDNSAAPYVLENAGLVVPEQLSCLYVGLHQLIGDPDRRKKLGEEGIKLIKTKYSLNNFIENHIDLYEEVYEESKK